MKWNKLISLILVILGILMFVFAMYAKQRVSSAKKAVHSSAAWFPSNPVDAELGRAINEKISAYDKPIMIGLVGGIALIVIGAGLFVYTKRR